MSKTIFEKEYDGESIIDIENDLHWVLADPEQELIDIPVDEWGIHKGTFKVVVTWSEE